MKTKAAEFEQRGKVRREEYDEETNKQTQKRKNKALQPKIQDGREYKGP